MAVLSLKEFVIFSQCSTATKGQAAKASWPSWACQSPEVTSVSVQHSLGFSCFFPWASVSTNGSDRNGGLLQLSLFSFFLPVSTCAAPFPFPVDAKPATTVKWVVNLGLSSVLQNCSYPLYHLVTRLVFNFPHFQVPAARQLAATAAVIRAVGPLRFNRYPKIFSQSAPLVSARFLRFSQCIGGRKNRSPVEARNQDRDQYLVETRIRVPETVGNAICRPSQIRLLFVLYSHGASVSSPGWRPPG